jgi:hypothetical protein
MAFGRAVLACYFTFIAVYYTAKLLALRARTGLSHAELGDRARPNMSRNGSSASSAP